VTHLPACPWPIAALLPHSGAMLLLDRVLGCDEQSLTADVTIRESSPFAEADGVPAYVGLEFMAQSCGAFAGAQALRTGEPVRIGFLLGTRDYEASRPWFRQDERLVVTATMVFRDAEMGVFDCRIESGGETVATARLNVFQPQDLGAVLARGNDR
jgi:predicted hotdog family 3-hydroxylacyl-ACP dehydratase